MRYGLVVARFGGINMKKWLIAGLVIIVILIVVLIVVLAGGGGDDDGSQDMGSVKIPIKLEAADNVGSIGIELTYDSSVLEMIDITAGELAANAMMEYNINSAGLVVVGIIDSSGINGDGIVAEMVFNVIRAGLSCDLILDTVETHDATSLVDILNETSDGSFDSEGSIVIAPIIKFAD